MSTATTAEVRVGLDAPGTWYHRGQAMRVWSRVLANEGLTTESLDDVHEDEEMECLETSRAILSRVGGLVVANYGAEPLPFDSSVLLHIDQAAEIGIPVFVSAPGSERFDAKVAGLPGEVIPMRTGQHAEIMERLGEQ